jgi:hypothetical protein
VTCEECPEKDLNLALLSIQGNRYNFTSPFESAIASRSSACDLLRELIKAPSKVIKKDYNFTISSFVPDSFDMPSKCATPRKPLNISYH